MMLNTVKESFKITNECIIIATPLILFSLLASLYLILSAGGTKFGLLSTVVLLILMLAAFLSGWFYVITNAIKDSSERTKDYSSLWGEFTTGVGSYFLNILGLIFVLAMVSFIIYASAIVVGKNLIGSPNITYSQIVAASTSIETMKAFANSLTPEQIAKINSWNLLLFSAMIINYFAVMFYTPTMFFKERNPFKAYFISLKDLFSRHIIKNILLYVFIFVSYFFLLLTNAIFGNNIIVHFILTIVNFYYATFVAILVFNYYYSNYAKIGSAIDKTV